MEKKRKVKLIVELVLLTAFLIIYFAFVFTLSIIREYYPYGTNESMVKIMDKVDIFIYVGIVPVILVMMIIPTVIMQLREMRNKDYYYTIPNLQKRPEEPEDKIVVKEQEDPKE